MLTITMLVTIYLRIIFKTKFTISNNKDSLKNATKYVLTNILKGQ